MKTVWKYQTPMVDTFSLLMPKGAECLHFNMQNGVGCCLWARVDPEEPTEVRRFRLAGTGLPDVGDGRYIGTAILEDGGLVFHLFELVEEG